MYIWVSKITGDLDIINGLNHYIGMKIIEPDSIKELSLMPYIVGSLMVFGLVVGFLGKKKLLAVWVILFVLCGIAGGVDFYIWEYDYGTNLNPEAAIKVPGMSYQPPFFGSKELLNFVAYSYPDTGGWVLIAAGLLSIAVYLYEIIFHKTQKQRQPIPDNRTFNHHVIHSVTV